MTLTGVGGVGKTRLALEVATQLADEFVDGVWFFELAAVADPAAVPDAVAAVLGITQQPGKSVGESVASALEGRSRLLVFDNCEHVVDSVADLVAAILAASATVKVLATSREGIGVADELLWRVPSLDVGAAVELFVERAQSMVSDTLADGGDRRGGCLSSPRRDPVGDRVGGLADGVDDGGQRCVIVLMTVSNCWWDHDADWSATRHCVTRWRGLTTCSMTLKRQCWNAVRCSLADSTSRAPAR